MSEGQHSYLSKATDAGLLGGMTVALWFLVRDVLRGAPLLTPSILGRTAKDDDDKKDDDKKDPPPGGSLPMVITPIMMFAFVCALGLSLGGCTPAMRKAVVYLLADTAKCIVGHPDLPDDQVAKLCGVEAAQHDAMRELLAQSRMMTAKAAADAAARAGAARCVAAGQ